MRLGRKKPAASTPPRPRHHTVLVVDDDRISQSVIKRALQPAGYHVITAGDGPEALRMLRSTTPSLFLIDLTLPQMEGWQLVQSFKENSVWDGIPVVIVTARTGFMDRVVMRKAMGVKGYVTKPIDPELLRQTVAKALNGK